jgi:Transposase DDE domain
VVLTGPNGRASPARRRQAHDRDAATGKRSVLWTHAVHVAATTIAMIDQQRWHIERFFKAIKQHLRVKTFLGTSDNAVMTQGWVALITDLILAFLRFQAGLNISFQQMLRLLPIHLFERRHLLGLCRLQPPDAAGSPL